MTVAEIWKYPCFRLFCSHRFIYTIAYILQFSLLFSVLAVVNLSISTIKFMKYRVLLYLPVYFILYLFSLMKEMVKGIDYTTYYVDILQMFVIGKRNNGIYLAVLLLLILFSVLLTEIQIRRKI